MAKKGQKFSNYPQIEKYYCIKKIIFEQQPYHKISHSTNIYLGTIATWVASWKAEHNIRSKLNLIQKQKPGKNEHDKIVKLQKIFKQVKIKTEKISIIKLCKIVEIPKTSFYYQSTKKSFWSKYGKIADIINQIFVTNWSCYGTRRLHYTMQKKTKKIVFKEKIMIVIFLI